MIIKKKKYKEMKYKKIIALLIIGLFITTILLVYKEETTNKEVPKKAYFVKNTFEWNENYG